LSDKVVKSVGRVFEVLELFEHERRPLAAIDVSQKLGYPLTSTHAVLKSINMLGYLDYSTANRDYYPSGTLTRLTAWMSDSIEDEIDIIDFLKALSRSTSETINLSRLANTNAKIFYGLESTYPFGVSVSIGTTMPVINSLTGIALVASMDNSSRKELFKNMKREDPDQYVNIDESSIDEIAGTLKRDGLIAKCDLYIKGIGAIVIPIVAKGSNQTFVAGIVGPSDRILSNEQDYRKAIIKLAKEFNIKTYFKLKKN